MNFNNVTSTKLREQKAMRLIDDSTRLAGFQQAKTQVQNNAYLQGTGIKKSVGDVVNISTKQVKNNKFSNIITCLVNRLRK